MPIGTRTDMRKASSSIKLKSRAGQPPKSAELEARIQTFVDMLTPRDAKARPHISASRRRSMQSEQGEAGERGERGVEQSRPHTSPKRLLRYFDNLHASAHEPTKLPLGPITLPEMQGASPQIGFIDVKRSPSKRGSEGDTDSNSIDPSPSRTKSQNSKSSSRPQSASSRMEDEAKTQTELLRPPKREYMRIYYSDFLSQKPADKPKYLDSNESTIDSEELQTWISNTHPRLRTDVYPLYMMTKDVLQRLVDDKCQIINVELVRRNRPPRSSLAS